MSEISQHGDQLVLDVPETPKPAPGVRQRLVASAPKWAMWALVALPILLTLAEILRAPRLPTRDYWSVLGLTANQNGTLELDKLLHLYHEHPIVLVGIVFWLDAKLFDGSSTPLGLFSWVLALGMFASLVSMLPPRFGGLRRLGVLAGLSALVFSSATTEYFGDGMMGVQWLLGLAPAVAALACAHRGRLIPAVLLAAFGSLGHGVAFPVWIALAVVFWLRRDPKWKIATPLGFGLLVFAVWRLAPWPPAFPKPSVVGADTYLGAMTSALGQVWSLGSPDLAYLAGAMTIGLLAVLAGPAIRERLSSPPAEPDLHSLDKAPAPLGEVAGWFGLATQILLNSAMIGLSRGGFKASEGLELRYVGIALLGVCALVVLLITRGPRAIRTRPVALSLIIALTVFAVGNTAAGRTRERYAYQPVFAVAMLTGAKTVIGQMWASSDFLEQERTMKIYPFNDDFTLGCGAGGPELGSKLDLSKTTGLPGPDGGNNTAGAVDTAPIAGDKQINGWAMIKGEQAKCVLMVSPDGVVVGGGTVGLPRPDVNAFIYSSTGRSGFQAVAGPDVKEATIVVIHNGTQYRLTAVKDAGIK
ncbi:hypothetical protein SAMN05421504_110231 [Amycolatopsis xylanica]|uniref:4-amino-4-deoxy-L-arabinose transferase n=1 Tax=Amycolatopsis xylanica TaxID=589385 RepID=A0A1H3R3K6_9PSEU|nr:hypothetical protein [Amycolatopsis xylanica]SDZ19881.1 hypothetical protein SAMN05421504_110231 [Amycolatopsis xylanica]